MTDPNTSRLSAVERRCNYLADLLRNLTQQLRKDEQAIRGIVFDGSGSFSQTAPTNTAPAIYILSPGGGIPARVGTTLGSAVCTLYSRVGTALTATSNTLTIYNVSSSAVGGGKYGVAVADDANGYVVVVESCA